MSTLWQTRFKPQFTRYSVIIEASNFPWVEEGRRLAYPTTGSLALRAKNRLRLFWFALTCDTLSLLASASIRVNSTRGILTPLLIKLRGTLRSRNELRGIPNSWTYLFFRASFTFISTIFAYSVLADMVFRNVRRTCSTSFNNNSPCLNKMGQNRHSYYQVVCRSYWISEFRFRKPIYAIRNLLDDFTRVWITIRCKRRQEFFHKKGINSYLSFFSPLISSNLSQTIFESFPYCYKRIKCFTRFCQYY